MQTIIGMKKLIAILLAVNAWVSAQESEISIESKVDKATITIGDPIHYSLTVTCKKGVKLDLPGLNVALGQFEIRDYKSRETELEGKDKIAIEILYTITTYATGEFEIPAVEFRYLSLKGKAGAITSDKIKITVKSVKPSEADDIKDIKSPVTIKASRVLVYLIIGAVILIGAGLLIYYFYLRKRWMGKGLLFQKKQEPERPPHEVAYEELEKLEQAGLVGQKKLREYYTVLSEIVRKYNAGRYGIYTLERTSYEILQEMQEEEVPSEKVSLFRDFYTTCDLVKFAKHLPADGEARAIMQQARHIVDATRWQTAESVLPAAPQLAEVQPESKEQENK